MNDDEWLVVSDGFNVMIRDPKSGRTIQTTHEANLAITTLRRLQPKQITLHTTSDDFDLFAGLEQFGIEVNRLEPESSPPNHQTIMDKVHSNRRMVLIDVSNTNDTVIQILRKMVPKSLEKSITFINFEE